MLYAWVLNGALQRRQSFDSPPAALPPEKGAWLPVETETDEVGPGERLALVTTVEEARVLDHHQAEAIPLEELKAAKWAEIAAEFAARMAAGFPVPGSEDTLQLRGAEDKSNWLTLKDACEDAIELGAGDQACTLPPRTTANTFVTGTWAQIKALMQAMRVWGGAMLAARWTLDDAVDQATDAAAVLAVDPASGWPE